jgi:DNA repair ATPase RecN
MSKELNQFCENYEVRVLNDSKRRARYHPARFFTDPMRADIIEKDTLNFETEKVYTVEIPEGRLRTLVEMERKFFNYVQHHDKPVDMFQTLMDKEREEAHYRHTNQAVQKAYEQYSIMLNLAGYQKKF